MNQAKLIEEGGQELLDMVLTVYVNFYFSELEIIDLCAKWIPKRSNLVEKFYLVHHAKDEVSHSARFKAGVVHLGVEWNDELLKKYRLEDIDNRFNKLLSSEDEIEVIIGLNIYAEGVLAMEELLQMGQNRPDIFPDFTLIGKEEMSHLSFGKKVLMRMIQENKDNLAMAQKHCDWYKGHITPYLYEDISKWIDTGIRHGLLSSDFRKQVIQRFHNEMEGVGLDVSWESVA